MDAMIYTAFTGARQTLDEQATVTHNLSNVTTTGFKAELSAARAVPLLGPATHGTRVATVSTTVGHDQQQGAVQTTGRALDIALNQDTWLAVQTPAGEAYTKRGDLQVSADGQLQVAGMPVLGEGGPVVLPMGADISIGDDGTISGIAMGSDAGELVTLERLKLVSVGDAQMLQRRPDGWFTSTTGNALPGSETGGLVSGALEVSNVNAVDAMVAMIANQRGYEMNMKVIQSADENSQRANSLLRVQG
ncbi:flagellar basal body rod protein FlgF [Pseudidiomarina insulisalsae]|uniref:Flagellar basal-body rod protein FlgF n=1 Tax=Pseudidiomarina insulisalsae TaxID=575789 RepID=A0A432YDG6_9GAMM|nr:flagellar basal body rod protein FlgF [Pseudidiomarina insulisalsae]RUO59038.1 flagellar biosynthesis protein FlgF [Pseudidiomarina insulisalsae]